MAMLVYYIGYMPIDTTNGKITDDTIEHILQLTGDEIKSMPTISEVRSMETIVQMTKDNDDFVLHSDISVDELSELIASGEKYEDIADEHNNCVVLMVPLARYNSQKFDIIDERFNLSIKDLFCKVNCVDVACMKYVLLCMFNNKWAYATIGKDKIISPIKVIMKL